MLVAQISGVPGRSISSRRIPNGKRSLTQDDVCTKPGMLQLLDASGVGVGLNLAERRKACYSKTRTL
jgi:hypothetical protein